MFFSHLRLSLSHTHTHPTLTRAERKKKKQRGGGGEGGAGKEIREGGKAGKEIPVLVGARRFWATLSDCPWSRTYYVHCTRDVRFTGTWVYRGFCTHHYTCAAHELWDSGWSTSMRLMLYKRRAQLRYLFEICRAQLHIVVENVW
ncbi:hypothetical protein Scep_005452 [Stephania cephalantha]|uniref:Uncharacterized protein n=1 Tax=Stephania cephalantha TaxID=152367 RepID=A0AAP0KUB5_9MAGN